MLMGTHTTFSAIPLMATYDTNKTTNSTKDMFNALYNAYPNMSSKDMQVATYIAEKTSRIASVTTRLIGLMDRNDSLAQELDRTSIRLVKDASVFMVAHTERTHFVQALATLAALFETAVFSGKLSRNNVTVLENELLSLADMVSGLELSRGRLFVESEAFASAAPHASFEEPQAELHIPTPQGHVTSTRESAPTYRPSGYAAPVADIQRDTHVPAQPRYRERVQDAQKDRRANILGLLQKKDRVTVKDVANVIRDVSEKTLQRELLALVAQGVLKKEGERRWTTYRLV